MSTTKSPSRAAARRLWRRLQRLVMARTIWPSPSREILDVIQSALVGYHAEREEPRR